VKKKNIKNKKKSIKRREKKRIERRVIFQTLLATRRG